MKNPNPGRWVVVIDAYRVPSGSATYAYVDAFGDPKLGAVAVADSVADRATGARWTAPAHAWVVRPAASPRAIEAWVVVTGRSLG